MRRRRPKLPVFYPRELDGEEWVLVLDGLHVTMDGKERPAPPPRRATGPRSHGQKDGMQED